MCFSGPVPRNAARRAPSTEASPEGRSGLQRIVATAADTRQLTCKVGRASVALSATKLPLPRRSPKGVPYGIGRKQTPLKDHLRLTSRVKTSKAD